MDNLPEGWFSSEDIKTYREAVLKIKDGGTLVELGVWKGRSLCSVADIIASKKINVYAVDTFVGTANENPDSYKTGDIPVIEEFAANCLNAGIPKGQLNIIHGDTQLVVLDAFPVIDLLFIDADHSTSAVLNDIQRWLPLSLSVYGHDAQHESVMAALDDSGHEFQVEGNIWRIVISNTTVVIPTLGKFDLALEAVRSIYRNTSIPECAKLKVCVVNNLMGKVSDEQRPFLTELKATGVLIINCEEKGFGHACNAGAMTATDNIIFMNDDCVILDYAECDEWLKKITAPLNDPSVGIVGVKEQYSADLAFDFLIGFFIAIKKEKFFKLGRFAIYEWGGCEDIELSYRALLSGYKLINVSKDNGYPIYHAPESTLLDDNHKDKWPVIFSNNKQILKNKFKKKVRVITPMTRPENLRAIKNSLESIRNKFPTLAIEWFIAEVGDKGVSADILDTWITVRSVEDVGYGGTARTYMLEDIDDDCYAYFLDDDNIVHPTTFNDVLLGGSDAILLKQLMVFHGIGGDNFTRLTPAHHKDYKEKSDTAQLIVLGKHVRGITWGSTYQADGEFITKIANRLLSLGLNYKLSTNFCYYNYLKNNGISVVMPTRNRHATTLPLCLLSVVTQTVAPSEVMVIDDSDEFVDVRGWQSFDAIFKIAQERGINILFTPGNEKGVSYSRMQGMRTTNYRYVWHLDDDCIPSPSVLESLYSEILGGAIAAAPQYLFLGEPVYDNPGLSNKIDCLSTAPNAQWFNGTGKAIEVEHFYSGGLVDKLELLAFEYPGLSPVGFREDTMMSLYLHTRGKIVITGSATVWHYHAKTGGIRAEVGGEMYGHDDRLFSEFTNELLGRTLKSKEFHAVNGKGDAENLLVIVRKCREEGIEPVVYTTNNCSDVFEGFETCFANQEMIEQESIYKYMTEKNWKRSVLEAYKQKYLW